MANARVMVNDASDATPAIGGLFVGLGFFVLQRVPQRGLFLQKIQANGGRVVKTEAQADHVIADHYRQDCPPGSISYRFIEQALQNGELPDPTDHMAGPPPGTARPVGSVVTGRRTRTEFTPADDRVLWQWMERTRAAGGPLKGNEIYKQLEAVNPRHTFQAWRDRYMKKLMDHPPAGNNVTVPANPPPSPPTAPDQEDEAQAGPSTDRESDQAAETDAELRDLETDGTLDSTEDDVNVLLEMAEDIENIVEDQVDDAWQTFAEAYGTRSAVEWRQLWHEKARPIFLRQLTHERRAQQQESTGSSSALSEDEGVSNENEDIANETANAVEDERDASNEDGDVAIKPEDTTVDTAETQDILRSSQKRKRTTGKRLQRILGKKQRLTGKEEPQTVSLISSDEEPSEEASAEHTVATDARESPTTREQLDAADVAIPTSDLNRDVQAQFDEEVFGGPEIQGRAGHSPLQKYQQPRTSARIKSVDQVSITADFNGTASPIISPSVRWTVDEDKGLLRGIRDGWKTPRTLAKYRIKPSDSAARNRKKELVYMYPQGVVPPHDVLYESSQSNQADGSITKLIASLIRNDGLVEAVATPHAPSNENLVDETAENDGFLLQSDLPTSDIDRAAEQQIQRELRDQESAMETIEAGHAIISSPNAQQHHTTRTSLEDLDGSGQVALTEANLANQQAMHREKQLRGTDLPPDEDDVQAGQTQDNFAAYLKSLLPQRATTTTVAPADGHFDLRYHPPTTSLGLRDVGGTGQMLLSSQAEIEATMDDLVHWPDSPPRSQLNGTSRTALKAPQFETQVAYPSLPLTTNDDRHNPSSPPFGLHPIYPHLPEPDPGAVVAKSIEADEPSTASRPASSSPSPEQNRYVAHEATEGKVPSVQFSQFDDDEEVDELELSVPMPEGGWNVSSPLAQPGGQKLIRDESFEPALRQHQHAEVISSISSSNSGSDDSLSQEEAVSRRQGQAVETQDIVNAETQMPDLTMPLPPDSDSNAGSEDLLSNPLVPRSSPHNAARLLESQKNIEHRRELPEDDVFEYIQTMVVRGHKAEAVIEALRCTTFDPDLAEFVLLEQKAGKGLPKDIAGVWSKEEDVLLEGGIAKALRQLEDKHTWPVCTRRLEFLPEWREYDATDEDD